MTVTQRTKPIKSESLLTVSPGCVATNLDGEIVILQVDQGVYYGLSDVGAFVWELIQQPVTVAAIQQAILAEYAVDEQTCAADLQDLVAELLDQNLITIQPAVACATASEMAI